MIWTTIFPGIISYLESELYFYATKLDMSVLSAQPKIVTSLLTVTLESANENEVFNFIFVF